MVFFYFCRTLLAKAEKNMLRGHAFKSAVTHPLWGLSLLPRKILSLLFSYRELAQWQYFLEKKLGHIVWVVNFCEIWDRPSLLPKARPFLWDSRLLVLFRLRDSTIAQEGIEDEVNLDVSCHCPDVGDVSIISHLSSGAPASAIWLDLPPSAETLFSCFLLLFQVPEPLLPFCFI